MNCSPRGIYTGRNASEHQLTDKRNYGGNEGKRRTTGERKDTWLGAGDVRRGSMLFRLPTGEKTRRMGSFTGGKSGKGKKKKLISTEKKKADGGMRNSSEKLAVHLLKNKRGAGGVKRPLMVKRNI